MPPTPLTEAELRLRGLSQESREALSPELRSAIVRFAERAAQELCASGLLPGISGVAINLLGDRTQLNAAFAGPLLGPLQASGVYEQLRLVPVSVALCARVIASADGYLDLSTGPALPPELSQLTEGILRGRIQAYAGVGVELEGVRVGTFCLYGSEPADVAGQAAREAAVRRYGALLSSQLTEAAQLRAENAGLRSELRGEAALGAGQDAAGRSPEEVAAWRETVAILGDVERAVAATGDGPGARVAACVVELRPASGALAIVATSEVAVTRHGMRPGLLRQVGDADPVAHWREALAADPGPPGQGPRVRHLDALATAPAAARLGTAPGAFASSTVAALPRAPGRAGPLSGLVVLCERAALDAGERAAREALVGRFAAIVAEAYAAALAVHRAPARRPAPSGEDAGAADAELLAGVRKAFGGMKLKALLALAEERGVPGADDAESTEELLQKLAAHMTVVARRRRAYLEALSVRELIALGEASCPESLEDAESKRDLVEALLRAEGLLLAPAAAPPAPIEPLPVPPRVARALTAEQAMVVFDDAASWVREAVERSHEELPFSQPGGWDASLFPRPPVPRDESARTAAIERLGVNDLRDWSGEDLATLDGIAAAVAAVAGTPSAMLTIIHREEHIVIGATPRAVLAPFALGDERATPRVTSYCQYGVAKGAPLAIVDVAAPEAGRIGLIAAWEAEHKDGFNVVPRAYLGVPMVTSEGVVLGNVCAIDGRPRPDFGSDARLLEQLGALAAAAVNLFELRRLRSENAALHARRSLDVAGVEPLRRPPGAQPPTDRVALLMTDIEGSTALHERDPALMKQALDLHDAVLRRAIADNGGIELTTEGDAFIVAFHTAADAIRCCFDAQLRLLEAPWPAGLERLGPSVGTDEARGFRGCRVRMTVHFSEAGGGLLGARAFEVSRHGVTRRPQYRGRVVDVCRFFSDMPSGGQILVTEQAFDEVSLALTAALGDPLVLDLGRYEDATLGDVGHAYQLLPRALAAREFTPPLRVPGGARLTSPGYVHAPRTSPLVVGFVLPVGLSELRLQSDAAYARGLEAVGRVVRDALAAHGGYEMKENDGAFMCAFAHDRARQALEFSADVHGRLAATTGGALRVRIGLHGGDVTIEPHPATGRMDAFGPPCNRAARLAKAASPDQTIVDRATAVAGAASGLALPLFELGEHGFRGLDEPVRVVQVGEGFFPPIRSLGFDRALLEFDCDPANHLARARGALGLLDALGADGVPGPNGRPLERARLEQVVERALAAREAQAAASRIPPGRSTAE